MESEIKLTRDEIHKKDIEVTTANASYNKAIIDVIVSQNIKMDEKHAQKMRQVMVESVVIPPSMLNISADVLKYMLIDTYIAAASKEMILKFTERVAKVNIQLRDKDIVPLLEENWAKKSITSKREEGLFIDDKGTKLICITLTW